MAIKRITISVPANLAAEIKKAAGKTPVSAWVTKLVEERLRDDELERLFDEFYRDVAPGPAAKRRTREIMKRLERRPRRRKVA